MAEHSEMFGAYCGTISEPFRCEALHDRLCDFQHWISRPAEVLTEDRNRVLLMDSFDGPGGVPLVVVVKIFGRRSRWWSQGDASRGSRARRSWRAAEYLCRYGVGTPAPVAYIDRWEGRCPVESAFLSLYTSGFSDLRAELIALLRGNPECWKVMSLLQVLAPALRALHDCGMVHNDLGNQNIGLRPAGDGRWDEVQFFDLNRARMIGKMTLEDRAKDLSRLTFPSELLRILYEMYFEARPPIGFSRAEARFRRRYQWHARTRIIRHPLREARRLPPTPDTIYPLWRDVWIWDEHSSQPINSLGRKDRTLLQSKKSSFRIGWSTIRALPRIYTNYRHWLNSAGRNPVVMDNKVGMAVEAAPGRKEAILATMERLGPIPVLVRFYRHQDERHWDEAADVVHALHARGHEIAIALLQDREAVLDPTCWRRFLHGVLRRVHTVVTWAEIGHAVNRVKWGIWDTHDTQRLFHPVFELRQTFPGVKFMGPAAIDFEFPYVVSALDRLPSGTVFDALSHHLYVDRRGAPENFQGRFDALRKCALARAIASTMPATADRLVISEVNWPLLGTGIYSPVNSPYNTPGPRSNDPSVSEQTYAEFMIRYLLITLTSGLVDRVYWWRLAAHGFGLIDDRVPDGWQPRPAFVVLSAFLRILNGATFLRNESPCPGVHFYWFRQPDGTDVAVAYTTHLVSSVEFPFESKQVLDPEGNPLPGKGEALQLTGAPQYVFPGVSHLQQSV